MTDHSSQNPNPQEPWGGDLERQALAPHAHMPSHPQAEDLSLSSVWRMASPEDADAALGGTNSQFVYRRDGHPNERTLATKLAELHGASRAVLTAQGMSAISSLCMAILRPGATAWLGDELYGRTSRLFATDLARWGVNVNFFSPTNQDDLQRLSQASECNMVFIETLTNPMIRICDIELIASLTRKHSAKLVVDNTFATHLLCRPLRLGADLVVESLGKIVNGHSDTMLGVVAGSSEEIMADIAGVVGTFGMASSPLDCYLTHRSLLSLAVRMERACQNALALAENLARNPHIVKVAYPGLSSSPDRETALRMMHGGFGWMLTIELAETVGGIQKFLDCLLPEIAFVPSLGDAVTTVSHPESTSHRGLTTAEKTSLGITANTVRISCGLEPTDWLIEHFDAATKRH